MQKKRSHRVPDSTSRKNKIGLLGLANGMSLGKNENGLSSSQTPVLNIYLVRARVLVIVA